MKHRRFQDKKMRRNATSWFHLQFPMAPNLKGNRQTCWDIYQLAYIHTYIRTYIHTYVRTYIHTYVHTYIHTLNLFRERFQRGRPISVQGGLYPLAAGHTPACVQPWFVEPWQALPPLDAKGTCPRMLWPPFWMRSRRVASPKLRPVQASSDLGRCSLKR